jgi:acetyltransferase
VHERLARICHTDYDREIALVAESGEGEGQSILGIVRLSKLHGTDEARLSILIGDPFQGIGLGSELIRRAVDIARQERLSRLSSIMTADNQVMLHIFEKLGFTIKPTDDEKLVSATIKL